MAKNSIGCKTYRNFFIIDNEKEVDAMENGRLSCAFFVSGILSSFNLIKSVHGTVENTVLDLEESGWNRVKEPNPGDIIVWEAIDFGDGDIHKHIGFYIGDSLAVSNSSLEGYPVKHEWTFGGSRKVEATYRIPKEIESQ